MINQYFISNHTLDNSNQACYQIVLFLWLFSWFQLLLLGTEEDSLKVYILNLIYLVYDE